MAGRMDSSANLQYQSYVNTIVRAVRAKDGKTLARILSFRRVTKGLAGQIASRGANGSGLESVPEHALAFIVKHMRAVAKWSLDECDEAIKTQIDATKSLSDAYKHEGGIGDNVWLLLVLRKFLRELRLLARTVDKRQASVRPKIGDVAECMLSIFREYGTRPDHADVTLIVVTELMPSYFQLNNPRNCIGLVAWAETKFKFTKEEHWAKDAEVFWSADVVAYFFWRARFRLLDAERNRGDKEEDKYVQAGAFLEYALQRCDPRQQHNLRAIYMFLVPVKLMRNQLPTKELLARHNLLDFYGPFVDGLRTGNFKLYQDHLEACRFELIRRGFFLLFELLKTYVYRNFFRKCWLILEKDSRLSIRMLFAVHQSVDPDSEVDLDELECILATLIYKKLIKGYISHEKRMLVLSKSEPFPKLTAR